jgi:elongator complex protein 2
LIGHEDWIRDIDVCQITCNQLLIASSSQDNYIRLWKLDSNLVSNKEELSKKEMIIEENLLNSEEELKKKILLDDDSKVNDETDEPIIKPADQIENELRLKSSLFTVHSNNLNSYVQYSMNLESVLYGHEDWIYTVKFHPRISGNQPLILISASMDKTIVVWKYDEKNSIWIDAVI